MQIQNPSDLDRPRGTEPRHKRGQSGKVNRYRDRYRGPGTRVQYRNRNRETGTGRYRRYRFTIIKPRPIRHRYR